MRKFAFGLKKDLILESKTALLMRDMDMSRLTIHMQQVEDEKRRQAEYRDMQVLLTPNSQAIDIIMVVTILRCKKPSLRQVEGFYEKGRDKCFKCVQVGHQLRDCTSNKVSTGENKILMVSYFVPTPDGMAPAFVTASSFSAGWNRLYTLASCQESEVSSDIVTGTL
ncbi:uncharacterized protein LOC124898546 [Capsicum annuum]|uniref:uncharacterized protein LOC124898546 n=1 Tax=Capsicum annuum TaxID=4072 RepID=UPI001FB13FEA|nr:uncharacterized protein LOC124898546 [Capsicum annuum]